MEATSWSERFNDANADVTFVSSDGIGFRIQSALLRAHTEALAPQPGASLEDPAPMTEDATVLDLLFDFIHPDGEPIVELKIDFDLLLKLAEAAAKYQVFPAMFICTQELQKVLPAHAIEILAHAYKHRYHDLANNAAVYALDTDPSDVIDAVPEELYRFWLQYRKKWTLVQRKALTSQQSDAATSRQLAAKLSCFNDLNRTFNGASSGWRNSIQTDVNQIPKFAVFIGWKELEQPVDSRNRVKRAESLLIIETCDGTEYRIPLETLQAGATTFVGVVDNRVRLPDSPAAVEILLRFVQPTQTPALNLLSFTELKDVALAAEKYSIRQARGLCRILMRNALEDHPHDVFHYAAEANYLDILDLTAPLVLGPLNSFNDAVKRLPANLVAAWVLYYQQWQDAVRIFIEALSSEGSTINLTGSRSCSCGRVQSSYSNSYCSYCGNYASSAPTYQGVCQCQAAFLQKHVSPVISILLKEPGKLRTLDSIISAHGSCSQAQQAFNKCTGIAKETIGKIPPISSFI